MDTIKQNAPSKYPWERLEDPDLKRQEPTEDLDNLDNEQLDLEEYPEDPDYNKPQPWDNTDDSDYNDITSKPIETKRRYKALCYEDIRLWIV